MELGQLAVGAMVLGEVELAGVGGRLGASELAEDAQRVAGLNAGQLAVDAELGLAGCRAPGCAIAKGGYFDAELGSRPLRNRAERICRRRGAKSRPGDYDHFNSGRGRRRGREMRDVVGAEEVPVPMMPAAAERGDADEE